MGKEVARTGLPLGVRDPRKLFPRDVQERDILAAALLVGSNQKRLAILGQRRCYVEHMALVRGQVCGFSTCDVNRIDVGVRKAHFQAVVVKYFSVWRPGKRFAKVIWSAVLGE